MTIERLKSQILDQIDHNAGKIKEIGEDIFRHPELGYKETRTAGIVAKTLSDLGLAVTEGLGITEVAARLNTGRPGPKSRDRIRAPGQVDGAHGG